MLERARTLICLPQIKTSFLTSPSFIISFGIFIIFLFERIHLTEGTAEEKRAKCGWRTLNKLKAVTDKQKIPLKLTKHYLQSCSLHSLTLPSCIFHITVSLMLSRWSCTISRTPLKRQCIARLNSLLAPPSLFSKLKLLYLPAPTPIPEDWSKMIKFPVSE